MKSIIKQIFSLGMIILICQSALAQFDASINLSDLNGTNGFSINGVAEDDRSGNSVSHAGDVNGDGIDDVIIGAWSADPNGNSESGSSYVVYGSTYGFAPTVELSSLNESNGFTINGVEVDDHSGISVSRAGDVNNDGINDVIIGATGTDPNGNSKSGSSYVVFGSIGGFTSTVELSSLDGSNGFTINGIAENDQSSWTVSHAGDVNGDGVDDVIIGAWLADPNSNSNAGSSYVVFGSDDGFTPTVELSSLDGSNGFAINGVVAGDGSGRSVSYAGDVNSDGIDDVVIGAPGTSPNGNFSAGSSYVVFGNSESFPSSLELSSLNGISGFTINGVAANDLSGVSVSYAGDVNDDGIDDLIIGAPAQFDSNSSGSSYVVFGKSGVFSSELNLSDLNGSNGFTINAVAKGDQSGDSVSHAGDINGDGIDDVIIGARFASPNGIFRAGSSYVVFGSNAGFAHAIELSSLNGNNGFAIEGVVAGDVSGISVSHAGDVNGDGIDDVIVGALGVDLNGNSRVGSSYVVFGSDVTFKNGFE